MCYVGRVCKPTQIRGENKFTITFLNVVAKMTSLLQEETNLLEAVIKERSLCTGPVLLPYIFIASSCCGDRLEWNFG